MVIHLGSERRLNTEILLLTVALVLLLLQLTVSRPYVFFPFAVALLHIPQVGIFNPSVTVLRLVLLGLLLRAILTPREPPVERQGIDLLVLLWATLLVLTGFAHGQQDGDPLTTRSGIVFDLCGAFVAARLLLRSEADLINLAKGLAVCVVPLALLMWIERRVVGMRTKHWVRPFRWSGKARSVRAVPSRMPFSRAQWAARCCR